jgi:hypothetical protein
MRHLDPDAPTGSVTAAADGRTPSSARLSSSVEKPKVLAALDAEAAADSAAAPEQATVERRATSAEPVMAPEPEVEVRAVSGAGDDQGATVPEVAASQPLEVRPRKSAANGVVDLEALRQRARQLRAARAASGEPRRNPFFDWDGE